jgi:hypothetical protein
MPPAATPAVAAALARAEALWQQGDVAACETELQQVLARDPAHEAAAQLLARLQQSQGRLNAAAATLFELCRQREFAADLCLRAAQFIQQCQQQTLADRLCDAALDAGPAPPELLAVAGNVARETGAFDKARARYLAALDAGLDLERWYVLGALAHTRRYSDAGDADLARFARHFDDTAFSPRARAASGFGLAKAYDDLGDWRAAAQTLRAANALVRTVLPWSGAAWRDFVAARMRETPARTRIDTRAHFTPVFVLGLPRSGTTLTATRLAQHPDARDRGELRTLRFISERLAAGAHLGDADALDEAAALYFTLSRQDDAPAFWYIDQDPLNFRFVHLIAALFPQARVIHCRRNRRDTALSLWSQDFAHADAAFAYDFDAIAEFAAGHDTLMAHWQRTLPLPIHTFDYETLVAEPEATLAALRRFVGLPPRAESESAPNESAPINSASVWQARQPIYARSVGRWRQYLPFVAELERFAAE